MRILVTGAAGFIGFHLCKRLLSENHEVVGIDNINDYYNVNLKYARLAELGIYSKEEIICNGGEDRAYQRIEFHKEIQSITTDTFQFWRTNIEEKEFLFKIFEKEKFDIVIHLAAQAGVRYSIENPDVYVQSNIVGFLNVLEACRQYKPKHLVYASSSSVYGSNSKIPFSTDDRTDSPVSLYAATKKTNELMAYTYSHLYGIKTTGLRFFTVYGPWGRPDMAPMLFANSIYNGLPIKVFNNGKLERDFTYIDDIVEGLKLVACNESIVTNRFELYNLGNGKPVDLMDFVETIETVIGKTAIKTMLPMQDGDVYKTWADCERLEYDYGYNPKTSINIGISNFIEWYKRFYQY